MDYIQINPDNVAPVPRRPRTNKVAAYLFYRQLISGGGGIVTDDLVLRSNFYDMANLSLDFPSNGSAVFNGTSDYITFPSLFPHTQFTLCFWVNRGSKTGVDTGFINGTGYSGNGYYTDFNAANKFAVVNGTNVLASISTVGLNQWDYVSVSYDGTTKRLYVNGSLEGSSVTTITTPTTYSQFGRYINTTSYFTGNIANLSIWNRALSSDEINAVMWKDYDNLSASEQSGLQAWYSLDDISGTSVPDSTGNYNGTAY